MTIRWPSWTSAVRSVIRAWVAPSQTAAASSKLMPAGLCASGALSRRQMNSACAPKLGGLPKMWSPTWNWLTAAPTAATSPASSTPSVRHFGRRRPPKKRQKNGWAARACVSVWVTVVARIRMRTSSSLGTGRSTSSTRRTSGGPYRSWTTAFMPSLPSLPDVPRTPFATDRRGDVERGRRRGREHQDVAIVVGCPVRAVGRSHERRPGPGQPTQALIEPVVAGPERSELEPAADEGRHVRHHHRAETCSPAVGRGRDGLDIAGSQLAPVDMQLSLDDGGVSDDLAVEFEHEMDTACRMVPVVVGEPLLLVRPECSLQQLADGRHLWHAQVLRRHLAQARCFGFDLRHSRRSPHDSVAAAAWFSTTGLMTRNLRLVLAPTCSTPILSSRSDSRPPSGNSRRPPPSSTGMTSIRSSSTRPARRSWRITSTPPTTVTALSPAAAFAWLTADSTPSVTKVNVRCSSSFGATRGGSWVSTKMGTWNS